MITLVAANASTRQPVYNSLYRRIHGIEFMNLFGLRRIFYSISCQAPAATQRVGLGQQQREFKIFTGRKWPCIFLRF
jgi:hypothetical protein